MKTYSWRVGIEVRARNLEAAIKKRDQAVKARKDVKVSEWVPVQMGVKK